MSLYRRPKSPYWWTRFQLDGTEVRLSSGTRNRREAEEFETVARTRAWRQARLGERPLSLIWRQVDLTKKRAWVMSSEMKAGHELGVPLSAEAIRVLKALPKNGDYLFQWHGERIDDCNTLAFQKAVKAAQVDPLRWHDLRHTWASWAVQGGVTLHELMLLGGWRSFSMVLRYAHFAPDHLRMPAAKVTLGTRTITGTVRFADSAKRKKT
jgi:integrase